MRWICAGTTCAGGRGGPPDELAPQGTPGAGTLRSRLKRISLIAVAATLVICVSVTAAFLWRLSRGPVALTFLTGHAQEILSAKLPGVKTSIGDVIVERDEAGTPRFRLRDIKLTDEAGDVLVQAPRAAVKVNGTALFSGSVEPIELHLIGPRVMVRRMLDGTMRLGFGATSSIPPGSEEAPAASPTQGKTDRADIDSPENAPGPEGQSMKVMGEFYKAFLAGEGRLAAAPTLNLIRVTEAQISVYDEANDAYWNAPRANLVFNRVPYGVALFADAQIASGNQPWRTEVVASYRTENKSFSVSAKIFDLVPADLSDKVFALSQLAQVQLPLSGRAEVDFTEDGVIGKASAELSAGAGKVGFPGYISEPILIDEGTIHLDYDPTDGDIVINNSSIYVGGSQARLNGRVRPVRNPDGKLSALQLAFSANNVSIDAADGQQPLAIDRLEFRGIASIEQASLEVEDLVLMAGDGGVRARGRFVGGQRAVGIYASGVVRSLPSELVKKLWPPVVAKGAREWIAKNILNARIDDGTFQIAIPGDALANALDDISLPDDMVDAKFNLSRVDTGYFEDLPPIRGASGSGHLTGDNFKLELGNGLVVLPSGMQVNFKHGTMHSTKLAEKLSPTTFNIQASADARAVLELIDQPPLGLVTEAGFDPARIGGDASVDLTVEVPLARKVPENSTRVTAVAILDKASVKEPVDGVNIEDGKLTFNVEPGLLVAKGPVKLNGIPAQLQWSRPIGDDAPDLDKFQIEASFDDDARQKLGVKLGDYMSGPVKVKVTAEQKEGRVRKAHVEADLAKTGLRIDPVGWSRPATPKTSAEFDLDLSDASRIAIKDLRIGGGDMDVRGSIDIDSKGTVEASFSRFRLNDDTDVAVKIRAKDGVLDVAADGRSFDARPLLGDLFGPSKSSAGEGKRADIRLKASIDRVLAYRGEAFSETAGVLRITDGTVREAELKGVFSSGAPLTLRIAPDENGDRRLSLAGRDGGAALRAANLYSKISGGAIDLRAILGAGRRGGVKQGLLIIRDFRVLDEDMLSDVDRKTPKKAKSANGPRSGSQSFSKLSIPFSVDQSFVRIGDALVKGPSLGASAQGLIRKSDGAMDIGGTIIPAYALNSALGEVPILGELLVGGKGQGMFGLNYALRGTMKEPKFLVNPVSAIAPGIFRRLFDFGGGGVSADGTPEKSRQNQQDDINIRR